MTILSTEQLPLFLLLVLPGFISQKVYDLQVPDAQNDAARYAMDALFYGTVNAGRWVVPLTSVSPGWFWPLLVAALVVSPVALSLAAVRILRSRRLHGWTRHPLPTAWDFFFARSVSCWILFRLKNGKSIGGYFGPRSFAGSFPNSRDIFVEQAWVVDEGGRFVRMVEGTAGTLVSFDDCELLDSLKRSGTLPRSTRPHLMPETSGRKPVPVIVREGYQPRDQRGYSPAPPPAPPRPPQGGTAVVNAPTANASQPAK